MPAHTPAQQPQKYPDLYNLGPTGGKANIVRADLPDGAKSGLKVEEVYKSGSGQNAGLKVGDVIYGAGGKNFGDDAYLELADAILAAESNAEKPVCTLKVKRGESLTTIDVQLTHYADENARRRAILDGALKWLAREQDSDGGFHSNMSPEVSQVVFTSLAGMAWLEDWQTYESNIIKAADFVEDTVGVQKKYKKLGGKNNDQTNWGLGYGGLFLAHVLKAGEEHDLSSSKLNSYRRKLRWIRDRIFKNGEDDGGFGAGPGGLNILDYVHLEVVSNFCLAALGAMQAAGMEVDADELALRVKYIESCQMEDGGIAYAHDKKWFSEVGRTAGAMNALASAGEAGRESYARMQGYFEKNLANAFDGHSTPTMHPFMAAIACRRHGTMDKFREHYRREYTMLRNPDFTFAYRPTPETARMGMNIDRDLGPVWTTCQWVLIQQLEEGAIPLWVGTLEKKPDEG
ncbi:MAG: DUF6288 domain-containing protein [Planctomycetes bacterium]|nr:DUF6288 domain-containing protein [Planctomycetota bacterium]